MIAFLLTFCMRIIKKAYFWLGNLHNGSFGKSAVLWQLFDTKSGCLK